MDINSFITKYLSNTNEADLSKITDSFNTDENQEEAKASIFSSENDLPEEAFINIISKATGKDSTTLKDEFNILFSSSREYPESSSSDDLGVFGNINDDIGDFKELYDIDDYTDDDDSGTEDS